MTAERKPALPRPWHVALSPAVPVLALLSGNFAALVPEAAPRVLVVLVPLAILSWAVLARIARNPRSAALVVSLLTLLMLSQSTVAQVGRLVNAPQLLPFVLLATLVCCGFILYRGGELAGPTRFANALMISSALLVAMPIVGAEIRRWRRPTVVPQPLTTAANPAVRAPDVYVIILDGYGRSDILRHYYGFDDPFVDELESLGFEVAGEAISNYAQTAQSLASSLNLDYLPALLDGQQRGVEPRQRLADLIGENRTFSTLAAAGYRIRFYASEYGLIRSNLADERPAPLPHWTDFEYGLHENSVLPVLSLAAGFRPGALPAAVHRRQIHWVLDHLERNVVPADDPPTLVFAHLLIPHPPFSFEPDGSPLETVLPGNLNDGSHWHAQAAGTGEQYQAGYVKAVRFLNSRLLGIIRAVCSRQTERPAIIYLQSDHGPGSRLDWEDSQQTDMRERFGILLAARFPDGSHTRVPRDTSPVNGVRHVLKAAVQLDLPPLEDRAFFSPWRQPFHFIDVTDRVRTASWPEALETDHGPQNRQKGLSVHASRGEQ